MDIELTSEQRSRLELMALHAGKSPAQILLEAATLLLDREAAHSGRPEPTEPQKFLSEAELDARFTRILRHQS
jgi:hypothetical protein